MAERERAEDKQRKLDIRAVHEAAKDCARVAADTARIRCEVSRIDCQP
jgi:hypothetical protein